VAGLLGAVLAREGRRQGPMALLTLVLAGVFDLLFFVLNELPATVPVALALIVGEVWVWLGRRRATRSRAPTPKSETAVEAAAGG
jgi:integral membrane sensor domain MASE1